MNELRDHLRALDMSAQYWPDRLHLVAEMPLTSSGKIQKFVRKEQRRRVAPQVSDPGAATIRGSDREPARGLMVALGRGSRSIDAITRAGARARRRSSEVLARPPDQFRIAASTSRAKRADATARCCHAARHHHARAGALIAWTLVEPVDVLLFMGKAVFRLIQQLCEEDSCASFHCQYDYMQRKSCAACVWLR